MKKSTIKITNALALLCVIALIFTLLAGCGGRSQPPADIPVTTDQTPAADETPPDPLPAELVAADPEPDEEPAEDAPIFYLTFEDGDTGGFTRRDTEEGTTTVEASSEVAYEGESSLHVSGRSMTWNGATIDVTEYITPGAEYEFSVWVYMPAEEGVTTARFMLSAQTNYGESENYSQLSGNEAQLPIPADTWTLMKGVAMFDAYDAAHIYIETGTNPRAQFFLDNALLVQVGEAIDLEPEDIPPLKDAYADYFAIGTAGEANLFKEGTASAYVLTRHFNAMTAENSMKPASVAPSKGVFTFASGDAVVQAAKENDMMMIGHTLAWHQQSPAWLNDSSLSREEAIENLQNHIREVVTHFGDDVYAWDVVNEIFSDGITNPGHWRGALRPCPWLSVIGDDYVEIAFRAAREANPNIKLYYNDYNLDYSDKREAVYAMAREFLDNGVPIDGIGMQGHYNMSTSPAAVDRSLELFSQLGLLVSITELDVTINTATGELAPKEELAQAIKYAELFQVFRKYSDVIERVTFWGISDATSWRSDRFPLLFDKHYRAKQSFWAVLDPDSFLAENARPVGDRPETGQTAEAAPGTATIGGDASQWEDAPVIQVNNYIAAWEGAKGEARVLYDETGLYILFDVQDSELNDAAINTYNQDSVEIFIDENNAKTDTYQLDDYQVRVSFNNVLSFDPNEPPGEGEVKSFAQTTTQGYQVQLFYPFQSIKGEAGVVIGFDLQINDANERGQRVSIAKWNDLTDDSFRSTQGLGNLELK